MSKNRFFRISFSTGLATFHQKTSGCSDEKWDIIIKSKSIILKNIYINPHLSITLFTPVHVKKPLKAVEK